MRELIRTSLPVETETPWGVRHVPPPTVSEALGVLLSAEAAARGEPEATRVFQAALRSWLPLRLCSLFASEAYPTAAAVQWAVKAIEANAPDPEALVTDRERKKGEEGRSWQDIDWVGKVSDYAHAFGCRPRDVMSVPFSELVLFQRGVERVHARADLRRLWTQGLPYQDDDRKRGESLKARQRVAGFDVEEEEGEFEGLTEEEALEKQREVLARMNQALGRGED